MRKRSSLSTLAVALALLVAASLPAQDPPPDGPPFPDSPLPPELQALLWEQVRDLEPFDPPIDIPGVGTIAVTASLEDDYPMPDGITYPTGPGDVIPQGTALHELDVDALLKFTEEQLQDLATEFLPGPPNEFDQKPNYTIGIENVDTREFPIISVEFKIVPNSIYSPPISVAALNAAQFTVAETVLGDTRSIPDSAFLAPKINTCGESVLALGVGIDTSCSVQKQLSDMRLKVISFIDWILDANGAKSDQDAISFFVFDGRGKYRAPDFGVTPAFASQLAEPAAFQAQVDGVNVQKPCLGSPIFESMKEELERLVQYRAGEDIERVLVTFADFKDTEGKGDQNALIAAADSNDVFMVGLGFGSIDPTKAGKVFDIDKVTGQANRGGFIQNGQEDIYKALGDVYQGLKYTYCLKYRTPWANYFNETVDLKLSMTKNGYLSETTARYPLPLVVPEDTPEVAVFMPLADRHYRLATTNTTSTFHVKATLERGTSVPPAGGPERFLPGEMVLQGTDVVTEDPDLGRGFWLRKQEIGPDWDRFFKVPTQFVRVDPVNDDPEAPKLLDATRYELSIHIKTADTPPAGEGDEYKSIPILTVQDRTPPHLHVKLSPDTGQPPSILSIREDGFDQKPYPLGPGVDFAAGERMSMAKVAPDGFGAKRARVAYRWFTADGQETVGELPAQRWSKLEVVDGAPQLVAALEDAAGTPSDKRVFTPDLDYADGGLRVNAGVRVEIEVRARDNYALLENVTSGNPLDLDAFLNPQPGHPEGPVHARFDLNRPEAQGPDVLPPFLPTSTLAELDADETRAGVTWWIESGDDRDRFDDVDAPPSFQYPKSDEDILFLMAQQGVTTPPVPLRRLQVLAQDGQGNRTRVTIPIFVEQVTFSARRLQSETQRN